MSGNGQETSEEVGTKIRMAIQAARGTGSRPDPSALPVTTERKKRKVKYVAIISAPESPCAPIESVEIVFAANSQDDAENEAAAFAAYALPGMAVDSVYRTA